MEHSVLTDALDQVEAIGGLMEEEVAQSRDGEQPDDLGGSEGSTSLEMEGLGTDDEA